MTIPNWEQFLTKTWPKWSPVWLRNWSKWGENRKRNLWMCRDKRRWFRVSANSWPSLSRRLKSIWRWWTHSATQFCKIWHSNMRRLSIRLWDWQPWWEEVVIVDNKAKMYKIRKQRDSWKLKTKLYTSWERGCKRRRTCRWVPQFRTKWRRVRVSETTKKML